MHYRIYRHVCLRHNPPTPPLWLQVSRVKAAVLTAPADLTLLLMEAEELHGKGLVSDKEMDQMREALLAQVLAH